MTCRNCRNGTPTRPRGLCWSCYRDPCVRVLFASARKYTLHGIGVGYRRVTQPPFATEAPPGSPEKIEVMAERARMGVSLFHQSDATIADERAGHYDDATVKDSYHSRPALSESKPTA